MKNHPQWIRWWRRDEGQATAFTLVIALAVIVLAGLVLDAGLAVSTKVHAISVAQAAARAGARELDVAALRTSGVIRVDPEKASTAAQDWLGRSLISGTVSVTGNQVTVTVTTARQTQLLHLVGISTIPITASATADAIAP